jgi:hypothetical protein
VEGLVGGAVGDGIGECEAVAFEVGWESHFRESRAEMAVTRAWRDETKLKVVQYVGGE